MVLFRNLRRTVVALLVIIPAAGTSFASDDLGLWTSVGADYGLAKGLSAQMEAEYRLQDNLKETDRWAVGASLSARLYRNQAKTFSVKGQLGYRYMNVYKPSEIVWKGFDPKDIQQLHQEYNLNDAYQQAKHRFQASVQAGLEVGRFKFTLRQRYQLTLTDSVAVTETKYRYSKALDDTFAKSEETEWKGTDTSVGLMRTRIAASYNIPHSKLEPFVSYEAFETFRDGFGISKNRYQAGMDYTFRKKHEFEIYYMYQSMSDADEASGSVIGLGYTFKF